MYLEQYKHILNDYPIFMAIAEDIGYDATGKETKGNELPAISEELVKFIKAIEEGKDRFFSISPNFDENIAFFENLG